MGYQPDYENPALQALAADMHANLGCYLIGCVLNLILMAILGMQCLDYYKFFPNDSKLNKGVVGVLFVAGFFQSACFFEMLYHPFINGFGDLRVWNDTRWTWWSEPVVSSIIAVFCQAFFLNRCWKVTKSWIVLIVALTGMVAAIAFGVACTYYLAKFVDFTNSNFIESKICASAWLAFSTATDIWISVFLVIHLYRERKRHAGFSTTDRIIASVLAYTLKTASLTSIWVVINLILYCGVTTNFAWSIFQFNMGKVYSISVLYTLLSRIDVRKILSVHNVQVSSSRGRSNDVDHANSAIHIRTEVERDYELDDKTVPPKLQIAPPLQRETSRSTARYSDSEPDAELGFHHRGPQDSIVDDDRSTRALRYNANSSF
ncbi:hypothetical protein E3Q18_03936 [Wallemia mellicola]|uniref:DUF6534 domain-containing protein n=1 Tax=Wallemia mellicola TaxID=1708541 RepID=A0A4T0TEU9_9BASI|nr:hypothetical protein E3Q23_03808 [Wallemia mellicola]TIB95175.1 hypothetical protein E3Q18_03936 [Wallemia mellicola]TIC14764.1 hypothetical protein E3Q14_00606 [Wallemia mellicola]TIC24019.1 hypothetical protein E3Q11_03721 [Wallemia mellicola]TIC62761.1 hypothetical protein E3Q01_03760 [Wallemia mellicola]